jgi:hypothetical protein
MQLSIFPTTIILVAIFTWLTSFQIMIFHQNIKYCLGALLRDKGYNLLLPPGKDNMCTWYVFFLLSSLFVVRCSLFDAGWLFVDVRCSLFVVRCSMLVVRCSLFVVWWLFDWKILSRFSSIDGERKRSTIENRLYNLPSTSFLKHLSHHRARF